MSAEATPAKPKRPTFADDIEASTTGEIKMIKPSHIRADHDGVNTSRGWAPYEAPEELRGFLVDDRCCFTLAQIEQKFATIMLEGQISEVEVSMGGDKRPNLQIGFLRHCAFLLAEVRGVLDQIPGMKGRSKLGIRAKIVPAPKTQEDYDTASDRNYAENTERLDLSPVQFAFYIKRKLDMLDNNGAKLYTRDSLAQKLSMSGRSISRRVVDRHMQLLGCLPPILLAVHEGRMTMAEALRKAPSNRGVREKLLPHSSMVRAIEHAEKRPPPKIGLTTRELITLNRLMCGLESVNAETPGHVIDWFDWYSLSAEDAKALAPEKPPREPKAPRKKSPPRTDEPSPALN